MVDKQRLQDLDFLTGVVEGAEIFNAEYERLLQEMKATGNREMIWEMRKILFKQARFLVQEWVKEKALAEMGDEAIGGRES